MANIESAADEMTTACSNCHEVYRDKDDEKDRCIPPAAAAK
jgi:cytochrome c553